MWRVVDRNDNPVCDLNTLTDVYRLIRHLRALSPRADDLFRIVTTDDERYALNEVIR